MSGRLRIAVLFTAGIVLAFAWGLYFVVISAVGFKLDLTLALLVPTIAVVAGLTGIELYIGRRRSKSREETSGLNAPEP
ncbi:MAG: hypothetical protein ABSG45_03275 [Nitrososphaerales archaeon]|jgi:hypothetical protein